MKKYFSIYLLTILEFIFIGCSQTPQKMYSGNWTLKLSGDVNSDFNFVIKNDLTFSFADNINLNGLNYDVFFSGEVIEDGTLNGSIFAGGKHIGNISGAIAPETGTGVWEGKGLGGTWIAAKQTE